MKSLFAAMCRFSVSISCGLLFAGISGPDAAGEETITVDVCVYGGTSSGVIAAAAVAKAGKSVIIIEQGRHLGGLSSGGLGETDIGNKAVIGGMSRDFYKRIGKIYGTAEAWKFAPSTAEKVFADIASENHLRVLLEHRKHPRLRRDVLAGQDL